MHFRLGGVDIMYKFAFDRSGDIVFAIAKIEQPGKQDIYCYNQKMVDAITTKLTGEYTVVALDVPQLEPGTKFKTAQDVDLHFANKQIEDLRAINAELILALVEGDII